MRHFSQFLSTFGSVRATFGVGGRQKWGISPVFCLLSGPRGPILESAVDKSEAFSSVFVYFRVRALKHGYGQNADFWDLPVKCGSRLRAKWRFLNSARKMQPPVTGKMAISEICP